MLLIIYQRDIRLCPTPDKSRKVPHPRTAKGGGEEEVGRAEAFGCQGMLPSEMCFCFSALVFRYLQILQIPLNMKPASMIINSKVPK